MPLLLPEHVVRDLRGEVQRDIAAAQRTEVCAQFHAELRRIDQHLELVWWPAHVAAPMGFVAGRYHIVRHNPDASGSVEPLVDDLGGFREPDSSIFEWLMRSDMWNETAMAERRRKVQAAKDAAAWRREEDRRERREELADRVNAATRASVSMAPDWSQTAAGKRGAVGGRAKE